MGGKGGLKEEHTGSPLSRLFFQNFADKIKKREGGGYERKWKRNKIRS